MGYAHISAQHLSTRLSVWPEIINSMMASEENILPNLQWVSTHSVCGSCGLHKVNLQWLQPKHKLCCFREVYGTDMKIPEFIETIQLKDPYGGITTKKNGQHFPFLLVCHGVIASRYHDNMHECSFLGRAYIWLSGSGCKLKTSFLILSEPLHLQKDISQRVQEIFLYRTIYPRGRECVILHNPKSTN